MFVTAGFIVGFDYRESLDGTGDDRLHRGDEHSGGMVGLLYALPGHS